MSFGGLVAAHACARGGAYGLKFAGCVMVAPCCDVEWTPALKFQASIGAFLAKVAPNFRGAAAVTPERLSADAAAVAAYRADPLVRVANVRFLAAVEIMKGFEALREDAFYDAEHFGDTPLLVMHGTDDKACFFPASEAFVRRVRGKDKTFVPVTGGSHLLMHDAATAARAREEVCAFVSRLVRRADDTPAKAGSTRAELTHTKARRGGRGGTSSGVAVTEAAETDIGSRL